MPKFLKFIFEALVLTGVLTVMFGLMGSMFYLLMHDEFGYALITAVVLFFVISVLVCYEDEEKKTCLKS